MIKTSYGEQLCRGLTKMWFPDKDAIYNYRPIWLKNPDTGRNLELDIYYPDLKLAVEFNGAQHHLLLQRRKDYFKQKQCLKLGILLLSVYKPMDLFKYKTLVKKHTGIKTKSGRSNEKFLWELQMYTECKEEKSAWYVKAQNESREAEVQREDNKKRRRLEKLLARRKLRLVK